MTAIILSLILASGGGLLIFDGTMGIAAMALVETGTGQKADRSFVRTHGLRVFVFGPALILAALAVARWG